MTPQEIRDMSAAVAQHFGWWPYKASEGRCERCGWPLQANPKDGCVENNCSMRPLPPKVSDLPPPDLTQPEWFVRLWSAIRMGSIEPSIVNKGWTCYMQGFQYDADTPELALLKAAYELVKK